MAALGGGCEKVDPRTQVMLIVDADDDYRVLISELMLEVHSKTVDPTAAPAADGGALPLATDPTTPLFSKTLMPMDLDAGTWPFEFALIPREGDMSRTYRVVATAMKGSEVIGVLRAESGFVPHKTLALQLRFETACLRKLCMDTETCEAGACVSSVKNPADLPAYSGNDRDVNPPGSGGSGGDTGIIGGSGGRGTIVGTVGVAGAGGMSGGISTGGGSGGSSGGGGTDDPDGPLVDAVCGDGKITGNETCDTAIAEGQSGACPTECRAASACETSRLAGTGCRTRCMPTMVTMPESGDGCCPPGADGNTDTDCSSSCGNGSVEMGETCDPSDTCPNASTCKVEGNNKCLKARVLGEASQCNASCAIEPIEECKSGDGCCPSGCSRANDNDCSASCGDRMIDAQAGELCEDGTSTPCPTECEDDEACTFEIFTGSPDNCNSVCTIIPILLPIPGDGCCPFGANANTDGDCDPYCGNRVVERGERCDGNCPNANACNDDNACTRDGVTGNGCNVQCTHQQITNASQNSDGCCPDGANANNDADCDPECGNNVREDGESCDGNCPTGCNDRNGCTNDTLNGAGTCNASCSFAPNPNACGANMVCSRNGDTAVTCTCDTGFVPNGSGGCVDDPCMPNPCGNNSTCDRNGTNFTCMCTGGNYSPSGNNRDCVDDPCQPFPCGSASTSTCSRNGTTANCMCISPNVSPTSDGRNCVAPNPCADNPCGARSTCTPSGMNFSCMCNSGNYSPSGNNRDCIDDPCQPDPCGTNSNCTRAASTAVCTCDPITFVSPTGDGRNCVMPVEEPPGDSPGDSQ